MNKPLRAYLVDDESLANREMRNLLAGIPDVTVIGDSRSIAEAAAKIPDAKPDVVFLDIELRDGLGFDLVPLIDPDIEIIFVTAYEQYAIRAFQINALDYLTKPIDFERLQLSINRLLDAPKKRPTQNSIPLEKTDRILLRMGNRNLFVPLNDIVLIHALGDYTEVVSIEHGRGLILKSMNEWENTLPKNDFFRSHRSMIVNIRHLKEMTKSPEGEIMLVMSHIPEPIPVSRRNLPVLRKIVKDI